MSDTPKNTAPAMPWRQAAVTGLAVGLALPASRAVAAALEPALGQWPAFALGLVAAGAAGALAGLAGLLLMPARPGNGTA